MIHRIASSLAAVALAAGVLAGCAVSPQSLSAEASSDLQTGVVAVAESAAAGDPAAALAQLDELEQKLDAALAAGQVTPARAVEIRTALDVVRADLSVPAATPTPPPAVDPAPVDPAPVDPAPVDTVDPGVGDEGGANQGGDDTGGGSGEDNSGPGNNNGNNGNGNGKGKGNGG